MKMALSVLLILTLAGSGFAADPGTENDRTNLTRLQSGDQIQVVLTNLQNVQGEFRNAEPEAITVAANGVDRSIPRADVVRVSRMGKSRRVRNAVLLGIAGAVVGAAAFRFGYACAETDDGCRNAKLATIGGGAAGAGVGATIPGGSEVIYRISSLQ